MSWTPSMGYNTRNYHLPARVPTRTVINVATHRAQRSGNQDRVISDTVQIMKRSRPSLISHQYCCHTLTCLSPTLLWWKSEDLSCRRHTCSGSGTGSTHDSCFSRWMVSSAPFHAFAHKTTAYLEWGFSFALHFAQHQTQLDNQAQLLGATIIQMEMVAGG